MYNCGVDHLSEEEVKQALDRINTDVRFLPKNSTALVQPSDAIVIGKSEGSMEEKGATR